MPPVSRAFQRRRAAGADPWRIPPGQYVTEDFPVLSAGPTPRTSLDHWSLTINGEVDAPRRWVWDEFLALPSETVTVDIHCVTKWSKLDTTWRGVAVDALLEGLDSAGGFVTAWCDGGYTTNLPLEDLVDGRAWVAYEYGGEPLAPEHGGPARLLVPHLYFWKSAKWLCGLTLTADDEPGFWETYGYHNYAEAGTALLGRLTRVPWRVATVRDVVAETPRARTIVLDVDGWSRHRAGQHVDVRLTADDGYQAQRSYSIASAPESDEVELTVERLDDGEVSPYLVDELRPGDVFEVRGPIGGHFTWSADEGGPLLLIAGGSGLVPLMSMLRHRAARGAPVEVHVLVSARSPSDLLYADELAALEPRQGLRVAHTYTREAPPGWTGWSRRIDAAMIADVTPGADARSFICGPTPFVERTNDLLVAGGHDPSTIRAERFGPTGG